MYGGSHERDLSHQALLACLKNFAGEVTNYHRLQSTIGSAVTASCNSGNSREVLGEVADQREWVEPNPLASLQGMAEIEDYSKDNLQLQSNGN